MPTDPVADFLRSLNTSDRARAAAWDAVHTVSDDAAAEQLLRQLPFSDEVRARLWDARQGKPIEPMSFDRPPLKAETPPDPGLLVKGAQAVVNGVNAYGEAGPRRVRRGMEEIGLHVFPPIGPQYEPQNITRGAHDVIVGGGVTALPMVAPSIARAAIANPLGTALVAGAGAGGQELAYHGAKAAGASEDVANLAGDVGGAGAGAAVAKLGVPALARWSANRKAAQMGRDYSQSTRDIQAALGVNADDVHRARPFLETVHNNGIPIVGKEDAASQLVKASDVAVDEIEQHVGDLVRQFPQASVAPMQRAVVSRVAGMPGASADDIAAAQQVIAQYGLNRPQSLAAAESVRVRLNAENRAVLEGSGVRQRTAAMTNPVFVARQEAANQLRDGIYGALEQQGVEGVRDLRLAEGSILKLRNAADPLTRGLRSESTVARTGTTSLPRRIVQKVSQLGGAAVGAQVGGPLGAAAGSEIGDTLTSGLTAKNMSKNELLERAFSQSFTSPPVMTVQRVGPMSPGQSNAARPLLPSGSGSPLALPPPNARPMPSAPDTSFVRGVPAEYARREVRGTLPPASRAMPAPQTSGVHGVPAKSHVQRDPRTGRMKRVYTSDEK